MASDETANNIREPMLFYRQ